MIKLVQQIKQNLFDGYDNDCWDKTFVVGGKEIRLLDICNNPLWKLKDRISIIKEDKPMTKLSPLQQQADQDLNIIALLTGLSFTGYLFYREQLLALIHQTSIPV